MSSHCPATSQNSFLGAFASSFSCLAFALVFVSLLDQPQERQSSLGGRVEQSDPRASGPGCEVAGPPEEGAVALGFERHQKHGSPTVVSCCSRICYLSCDDQWSKSPSYKSHEIMMNK